MYPPHFVLEYEPDLVEAALLRALQNHPEERVFRQQRDPLYEIEDPEAREAGFRALHVAWFARLGLGQVMHQALRERALILRHALGCKVTRARSARDEGAELFVAAPGEGVPTGERRRVVLRLRPERLAAAASLLDFLRHELLHIADMLDPAFGYQPALPPLDTGPTHERLLRERYRVLWDSRIDGRLVRLGWAPPALRDHRLREFATTFPMLGDRAAEALAGFFDGDVATHAELVRFACAPETFLGRRSGPPHQGERCPLCRFPTHAFEPQPAQLARQVLDGIRANFPAWEPIRGICQQCADMYRAHAAQRRTTELPGAAPRNPRRRVPENDGGE